MSKLGVVIAGLLLVANFAMADEMKATSGGGTLSGVVVDNACASGHKADIGEFVKTHTKDCALMPGCIASGYSLYTSDGHLTAFTKASNTKIVKFLKGKKATLSVEVKVKKAGSEFELVSIKNKV